MKVQLLTLCAGLAEQLDSPSRCYETGVWASQAKFPRRDKWFWLSELISTWWILVISAPASPLLFICWIYSQQKRAGGVEALQTFGILLGSCRLVWFTSSSLQSRWSSRGFTSLLFCFWSGRNQPLIPDAGWRVYPAWILSASENKKPKRWFCETVSPHCLLLALNK